MYADVSTNDRQVFRSRDLSGPIRGQYSLGQPLLPLISPGLVFLDQRLELLRLPEQLAGRRLVHVHQLLDQSEDSVIDQ